MKTTSTLPLPPALALALAFALALPCALPAAITDRPVPTVTSAFRVVTANLRGHSGGETTPSNAEDIWDTSSDYWSNPDKQAQFPRRRILRETILAQHADIYCFQECSMWQIRDFLDAMPGYAAFKYPRMTTNSSGFEGDSGEAILYSTEHFELLDQDHFWLTSTPRNIEPRYPGITHYRDASWAKLKDKQTGRECVVWFTHLQHNAADSAADADNAARLFEMNMILTAAALNPPDLPQFLFGDFNVGYSDATVQAAVTAGWRDTYNETYGNTNPGRTHHDFGSITTAGTKIDFVLVRGALKTHGAEVIKDYETIAGTDRYPSDHYFVSAVVSFDTTVPAATAASNLATTDTIAFGAPAGLALDTAGALYVADESDHTIYKNAAFYAGGLMDEGDATSHILTAPRSLALQDNFLYIADSDNRAIRLIDTTAGPSSLALYSGDPGGAPGAADGSATAATYARAAAIAVAPGGAIYVADSNAHAIRKIAANGDVTTLAGTLGTAGHVNGAGPAALFREPLGLALSHDARTLYVADTGNHAIRAINLATAEVTTPAGTPGFAGWGDGAGAASRFNLPAALAASAATLYVADAGNHVIRAIDLATNSVTRLAGIQGRTLPAGGYILYSADGGPDDVIFNHPTGLTLDAAAENLYVADTGNGVIRKIALATRQTTTLYAAGRIGDQHKLAAANTNAPTTPPSTGNASGTATITGGPAAGDIGGGGALSLPVLPLLALLLLLRRPRPE